MFFRVSRKGGRPDGNGGRGGKGVNPGPEYRITTSGSDEGFFAVDDPETRSPPKARRFMPRAVSRYFLNQISSPGLFSRPSTGPLSSLPGASFLPDLTFRPESKYL